MTERTAGATQMQDRYARPLTFALILAAVWSSSRTAEAGAIDCTSLDRKNRWVNALGPVEPARIHPSARARRRDAGGCRGSG